MGTGRVPTWLEQRTPTSEPGEGQAHRRARLGRDQDVGTVVELEAVGGSQAEQNAEVGNILQRVVLMGRDDSWIARWSSKVGDGLLYRGDLKGAVWG